MQSPESLASVNPLKHLRTSDIRGIAQLTTQAAAGVARISEAVHQSVWSTMRVPGGQAPEHTGGITGLVYQAVKDVTQLVGGGVDAAMAGLQRLMESTENADPGTPQREAIVAALNGVLGDRLVAGSNPLAIPMTLRYRGEVLNWKALPPMPEATGKVLLLIHGVCMNDLQRHAQRKGHEADHGEVLASELDYSPVYLRYNSGLHTSINGRELSTQLEHLVTHWPTPIDELAVVAHSMGGLLIRGAIHYARKEALRWPEHLKHIVFLGTPHHGAPLERIGNWVDMILGSTPFSAPFATLGKIRSAGITDLRYGHVVDEDWQGHDRFHRKPDTRDVLHLPEGIACYAVAATTDSKRSALANCLVGDGLVPLNSALGQHDDVSRNLMFEEPSQRITYRMNHGGLLSSPEVTRQLVRWLAPT